MDENEVIVAVVSMVLASLLVLVLGVSFFSALGKRWQKGASRNEQGALRGESARLERIEHMVEAMSIEIERISEGQRFTTRLLSERAAAGSLERSRAREGTS